MARTGVAVGTDAESMHSSPDGRMGWIGNLLGGVVGGAIGAGVGALGGAVLAPDWWKTVWGANR